MRASRLTVGLTLCSTLIAGATSSPATADEPTPQTCIAQNEQAGPLRRAGKLREARALFRQCSVAGCPDLVRNDCVMSATQLDAAIPSIVFAAQDGAGNDLTVVSVTMDGARLADRLDGTAIEVDPGEHQFRLEAAGQPPVEKRIVVIEGEKNRRERVVIGPVPPPAPASLAPPRATVGATEVGSRRTWALVLGGAGIAGMGLGAVTGLLAMSSWSQVKNDCGPSYPASCQNTAQATADRSSTMTTGTISTVAFIAGGAALAAGAILYLTAAPQPGGAALLVGGRFQ